MSAPLCTVCLDTGSKSQDIGGDLDCTTCDSATERMVMRNKLGLTWGDDDAWRAYQLGKAAGKATAVEGVLTEMQPGGALHQPAMPFDEVRILEIARKMPMKPWGIGSRAQDAIEFAWEILKAAAPVVPVAAQPTWKALSDVQWMNIVNHEHAYDLYSKDDAVHLAVKMTEAKCRELNAGTVSPVDMILRCPACHTQHIDAPDDRTAVWSNPPHRSHLCHECGHIWRPADVATNGVAAIKTKGSADSKTIAAPSLEAQPAGEVIPAEKLCALLPGPYYMDHPDGGSVPVLEQVERMAKDAARYRYLVDVHIGDDPDMINLEDNGKGMDYAIDKAIAMAQGEKA